MMRDEELRKVLEQWQAPQAGAELDRRVWESYKRTQPRVVAWKLWGAVAAGVVLLLAANVFSPAKPKQLETRLTAAGFRPIPDGAVTVVKSGEKP